MMSVSQMDAMSILGNDPSPLVKTMAAISEIESAPGIERGRQRFRSRLMRR